MSHTMLHDPDAVLDYRWDWSAWLAEGEQITSSEILTEGVDVDSADRDTTSVTAWLSGGTPTTAVQVTCRITTNQGRTDDRSITLLVRDR